MDLGSDYDMEAVGHTACGPFPTLGPLCPSTSETAEHACFPHSPAESHPSLGVMEWAVQRQGSLPPFSAATEGLPLGLSPTFLPCQLQGPLKTIP